MKINFPRKYFSSKLFYLLFYTFSTLGLLFYVTQIYVKWKFNPDVITTQKSIPSYKVPMPAVTICSPLLARKSKVDFRAVCENSSTFVANKCCPVLNALCHGEIDSGQPEDFSLFEECLPSTNDIFALCTMRHERVSCSNSFVRTVSYFVNCFTFNMLKVRDPKNGLILDEENAIMPQNWSLAKGYKNAELNYPFKATTQNQFGFLMVLDDEDESNICFSRWNSFRVLLHKPNEIHSFLNAFESYVEFGFQKKIQIHAKMITADKSLKSYSPQIRGCYYEGKIWN